MNWFKRAYQGLSYTDVGHSIENKMNRVWISDLAGNNFQVADAHVYNKDYDEDYNYNYDYDHFNLIEDLGIDPYKGFIQGRFDPNQNIVSLSLNSNLVTIRKLPNKLINRLYREFGNDITILDFSRGIPERVI